MYELAILLSKNLLVWLPIQVLLSLVFLLCLRSRLNQNYPEYDFKLIVDSIQDPAGKIASDIIQE